MSDFANTIRTFVNSASPIIIAIVAVAFLILGVMMVWPSEQSKEKAKNALPWVIIGAAIALGAVGLADTIGQSF